MSRCGEPRDGARLTYCLACQRLADAGYRQRKATRRLRDQVRPYGLTMEQYAEMLSAQNGRCAGCGAPGTRILRPGKRGPNGSLHIDHDHKTGKVRGLLCGACNNTIARLGDRPEVLSALAAYLKR